MILTFPFDAVRKLLSESLKNEFYTAVNGEDRGKGMHLVADEGIYLMTNAVKSIRDQMCIVFADQCNPRQMPPIQWRQFKVDSFGRHGINLFIPLKEFERVASRNPRSVVLEVGNTRLGIGSIRDVRAPKLILPTPDRTGDL